MRTMICAGLTAAALAFTAAGSAMAQSEATATKTAQPSIDWTIGDLLADPGAKAVIDKDLPGAEDDPRIETVKAMTLRAVAAIPDAQIDQAKLDAIAADLAALPKKAS